MKQFFIKSSTIIAILFFVLSNWAQAQTSYLINESFSSLSLPSGWVSSGVSFTTNYSKTCASMSSSAYMTTMAINKPGTLTFSHRASGNGKALTVEKSVAGGTWTVVGTVSPSSSTSWGSSSMSVNEGASDVKIRFTSSSGTIYISDIAIVALPDPVLTVTDDVLDLGTVFAGESSTSVSTQAGGTYLASDISVVSSGSGFEVSNDNLTFGSSITILKSASMPATFYVRYTSPASPVGMVSGSLTISSVGAPSLSVSLAALSSATVPTIMTYPSAFSFGYVLYGENSNSKLLHLKGKYLDPADGSITVSAPAGFEISLSELTGFSNSVSIPFSQSALDDTVYVRFVPSGNQHLASFNGSISLTGGGATANVTLSGVGVTSMNGIAHQYYISPSGNDNTGDGSFTKPWYNLSKAIQYVQAGDTIHCRGGVYSYDTTIRLASSGSAGKRICIFAYKDDNGVYEQPVFDFSNQVYGASNRAIMITGNYWYLFGIQITKAGDNGIKLEGNYCIVERCVFSYNGDSGIQLGFGHVFSDTHPGISSNNGSYCAYNLIVDCDSYQNYDPDNYGSDADGFACKMHNGLQNWFLRCRAWNNSDDAWDLYETDYPVFIIGCWGWHSGDASQHPVSGGSFQGNGNGIKMGGNGTGGSSEGKHEAWNCVTFNNNKTSSVKGFDQNSHKGGVKLVNCLAYNNGYDFMFEDAPSGTTNDFYNNVCLSNRLEINSTSAIMQNNVAINNPSKGWLNALPLTFSAADYNDLSEDAAKQSRSTDGALPTGFARLKSSSQLIDQGLSSLECPLPAFVDQPLIGNAMSLIQPINGSARDLGPYETNYATGINTISQSNSDFMVSCNDDQIIVTCISEENAGVVAVEIFDMTGRKVVGSDNLCLSGGDDNRVSISRKGLQKGIYIVMIKGNQKSAFAKVLLK